ncbi:MAG: FAD-dependent oxidoreductase [Armatimonadetes bacterium]|nr:FAD-dependent oxidoreductase [Armatimonadota bacterium]
MRYLPRFRFHLFVATLCALSLFRLNPAHGSAGKAEGSSSATVMSSEIAIYGATPSGISAALSAARLGSKVLLLERNAHIGGLMANGLGATDIKNRAAIAGNFLEFVRSVKQYYSDTYGADSAQVKACNDGYYFEPHVAELLFKRAIGAEPNITLIQPVELEKVEKDGRKIRALELRDLNSGNRLNVRAGTFIDATYEGDLAALAGAPFRVGREARAKYGEPYAGVIYWGYWNKRYYDDLSTGKGDQRIQAYNYRLCLTDVPENRKPFEKPENYNRQEFMILSRQVRLGQVKHFDQAVSIIRMPNGKSDTNNHTIPLISTDLPVENYPYPTASWEWRDHFAKRLRDYTLGFLYFSQNDLSLPQFFRDEARQWGLAKDEYVDNGNFPRQIYVREARRIDGMYNFTAYDLIIKPDMHRTRLQPGSIACGSYEMDSHATRKYEPGVPVMEGLLGVWQHSNVYQIPYGVIVPRKVKNLLVCGAISGTHMGFSTLRMEPCWMAMGQAAGTASNIALKDHVDVPDVEVAKLQRQLLADNAVLMYFEDVPTDNPDSPAIQFFGSRLLESYQANPAKPLDRATAAIWLDEARRLGLWSHPYKRVSDPFVDVREGEVAFKEIRALAERGMFTKEIQQREFRPYEALTPDQLTQWFADAGIDAKLPDFTGRYQIRRGEFLTILYNLNSGNALHVGDNK